MSAFDYQSPQPFAPAPDAGIAAPAPPTPLAPNVNGIPGAMGMPMAPYPPPPPGPADMKYTTETQQDGSILLRLQNADGTPGPVVKVIPPPMKKGKQ